MTQGPPGPMARFRESHESPQAVGHTLWALREVQLGPAVTETDLTVLGNGLRHGDARVRKAVIDSLCTAAERVPRGAPHESLYRTYLSGLYQDAIEHRLARLFEAEEGTLEHED